MIFGIFIGICIMSLFSMFALVALDEGKEELAFILVGPAMWLWIIIGKTSMIIYKKIAISHFRKNYLRFMAMNHGVSDTMYYIHKKIAPDFFKSPALNPNYYMRLEGTCENAKSLPYRQYKITPRGIGRKYKSLEKEISHYIGPDTDFYKKMSHNS